MLKKGALSGIRVVDLSRLLPGPYCSMILADHGAEVIAVEDPRYKASGHYLSILNRNKKHIALDLKSSQGKEIFLRLVKKADVVLEGFRPGVAKRLGVDYESIKQINPKIIYCSITGYGQTGDYRDRAGHDVNYLSLSGLLDQMGQADKPPSIPGVQIADIAGGGMNGAIGILLALMERQGTQKGQYIDISMTDGMVSFLPISLFLHQLTGVFPDRSDAMLSHRYACYNTYETADHRYYSVGAVETRFWEKLCNHLDVPEYIFLQYDETQRREIIEEVRKIFKTKSLAEWELELAELDACCEPVLSLEEVMVSPRFKEREMIIETKGKNGETVRMPGVPVKLSRTPGAIRTPPVEFGESTVSVLRDLGYSDREIEIFSEKNVF